MDNQTQCVSYLSLGYRDYIAARFLLNNSYFFQGITLASSAIEKYLKAILILNGKEKNVHLNRISDLKELLSECYFDVTQKFDQRFLTLLGNAYKSRYYDNLKEPITISFFVNQVIGELDNIISFIENFVIISIKDKDGEIYKTPYKRAIDEKNEDLFKNNYLFNGLTKKEHMEKPDKGYGIYIDPLDPVGEIEAFGENIVNKYDGEICIINFNILDK